MLRKEIEELQESQVLDFRCHLTVDESVGADWQGSVGFVTAEMITKYLHGPDETLVLLCGPTAFTRKLLPRLLKKLGYESENIFTF